MRSRPAWPALYRAAITNLGDDVRSGIEDALEWFRDFVHAVDSAPPDAT